MWSVTCALSAGDRHPRHTSRLAMGSRKRKVSGIKTEPLFPKIFIHLLKITTRNPFHVIL